MSEELNQLAKGIGKAMETVPELYRDAFQPAVQETGQLIARVPRAINAAFSGIDKWILNKEYSVDETKKLLSQKLKNVDPEKIIEPEPYVAVPAIQAITYSMNSDELRNLYANLLAKSMNIDTKELVHPSFVEIIKQLSPLDAQVFKSIMEREVNPCANLRYVKEGGSYRELMTNVTDFQIAPQQLISVSIDNLSKQNLIYIPSDGHYTLESVYDPIIKSDFYRNQERMYPPSSDGFYFSIYKKMIEKTNLGISFYKICIVEF